MLFLLQVTVSSKIDLKTEFHKARIIKELGKRVIKAARFYETKIINGLGRDHGSIPVGPGKRLRVQHSSPGESPLIQTFNLINSIRTSFNFRSGVRKVKFKLIGRVSTSVPYAVTLERGGSINFPQSKKKFTSNRLVNPLKTNPLIAKRPLWTPIFVRHVGDMIDILKKPI